MVKPEKKPLPQDPAAPEKIARPKPWNRWDWVSLGAVLLAALGARAGYWLSVRHELWFVNPVIDSQHFHQWALAIIKGDWLGQGAFAHSPLYAYFLALVYAVLGSDPARAAAVQLVLGAVSCGLIYVLGRNLFSKPAGVAAGLAQAFYGLAFFHEGTLLTAVLINVLNLGLLLFAYRAARKQGWVDWAAAGVFLGLSFLTRPNIALMAPVLVAWMFLLYRGMAGKIFWRSVLALGAAGAMLVFPVTLRNAVVLHEWMISVPHGGMNFYLGNSRQSTGYHMPMADNLALNARNIAENFKAEAERSLGRKLTYSESSRFWMRKAWREILDSPWHWQRVLATKFFLFFNEYEYTTSLNYYAVREITRFLRWPWLEFKWVAPWALLAMFWLRDRWKSLLPLYGFAAAYLASNVLIMGSSEYRYAVMPFFFLFAGEGLVEFYRVIRSHAWTRLAGALLLIAVFSLLVRVEIFGKPERNYHMATAHANFGHLLVRLGDFQGASEEYTLARDYVRNQPEYLSGILEILGKTYNKLQRYPEAQQVLEEAYALTPEVPSLIQELAAAATANGQYDKAVSLREQRIRLEPGNPDGYIGLGMTCLWAGKDREAEAAFAKALAIDPQLRQDIAGKKRFIQKNRQ